MENVIYILQNIVREGPGLLHEYLQEAALPYRVIHLELDDPLPPIHMVRALIVLGGPDSANDASPKIQRELAFIREALRHHVPYLGICLGMQLLVKAAGGRVLPCAVNELGFRHPNGEFYRVALTRAGSSDRLFAGLPRQIPIFHLHGETVELTSDIQLLATGTLCRIQMIKVGNVAYGIQGHLELTPKMLEHWLAEDPDLQTLDAKSVQQDFRQILTNYSGNSRLLFQNFFSIAGLLKTGTPSPP